MPFYLSCVFYFTIQEGHQCFIYCTTWFSSSKNWQYLSKHGSALIQGLIRFNSMKAWGPCAFESSKNHNILNSMILFIYIICIVSSYWKWENIGQVMVVKTPEHFLILISSSRPCSNSVNITFLHFKVIVCLLHVRIVYINMLVTCYYTLFSGTLWNIRKTMPSRGYHMLNIRFGLKKKGYLKSVRTVSYFPFLYLLFTAIVCSLPLCDCTKR